MPVSPVTPQTTAPAGKTQPGQASPMGQSQATQPTPNRGGEAQAVQLCNAALQFLTRALSSAGAASDMGKKIHKAMGPLMDLAPAGSVSPAGERNAMQSQTLQNAQNNQAAMRARMQAQQGGAGGGGAAGAQGMAA